MYKWTGEQSLYFYSLRILYIYAIYIDHICPPLPLSNSSSTVSLLALKPLFNLQFVSSYYGPYSHGYVTILWGLSSLEAAVSLKENQPPSLSSQRLPIAPQISVGP